MLQSINTWARSKLLFDEDAAVTQAEKSPTPSNVQFARKAIEFVTMAGDNYIPGKLVNYYGKQITMREKLDHLLLRLERITTDHENPTGNSEKIPLVTRPINLNATGEDHHAKYRKAVRREVISFALAPSPWNWPHKAVKAAIMSMERKNEDKRN